MVGNNTQRFDRRSYMALVGGTGIVGFSGCLDGDEAEADDTGTDDASSGDDGSADPMGAWAWSGLDDERDELTEEFTDDAGIGIDWETFPFGDYQSNMMSAMGAGRAPDMAWTSVAWLPEWADAQQLQPLDDHFDSDVLVDAAYGNSSYEGTLYAVPWYVDCRLTGVNRDDFEEAGLEIPDQNAYHSWDDFSEWAEELAAVDIPALVLSDEGLDQWAFSNGGQYYDDDLTESLINEPEVVDTMEFLRQHYEEDHIVISPDDADDDWIAGSAAMLNHAGSWMAGTFDSAEGLDWQYIHCPVGPDSEVSRSWSAGVYFIVPQDSDRLEEAVQWGEFILSDDVQGRTVEMHGGFPATEAGYETDRYQQTVEESPKLEPVQQEMENTIPFPSHPASGQMTDIARTAFVEIVEGGADPQDQLDQTAIELEELLD